MGSHKSKEDDVSKISTCLLFLVAEKYLIRFIFMDTMYVEDVNTRIGIGSKHVLLVKSAQDSPYPLIIPQCLIDEFAAIISPDQIEFFLNGVFGFGFVGVLLAFTKSTVSITHYLSNMIIPKSDGTQKFTDEVDELRAISSHMLGASRVQIPQNNLENLQSLREEDGTSEIVDPQDCLGSLVLEVLDSTILTLLLSPTVNDDSLSWCKNLFVIGFLSRNYFSGGDPS
ncbi:hypothetical protein Tco_0540105 [Tanacetum coccineum]